MKKNGDSKFSSFLSATRAEQAEGDSAAPHLCKATTPIGKRCNPKYVQVTAYILASTHREVKIALLQQPDKQQFSDLVEQLLQGWLDSHAEEAELPGG